MDFAAWFRTWLARHPLKQPRGVDVSRYTDDVMAKIRALAPTPNGARPAVFLHLVWGWPRLALIAATAAVGMLIVVGAVRRSQAQLASAIDRDAQLIAAMDELVPTSPAGNGTMPQELVQELQADDLLMLAESLPVAEDDQWLDQTMQLLEQLDEDLPGDVSNDASDDWLNELQQIDETELAANS